MDGNKNKRAHTEVLDSSREEDNTLADKLTEVTNRLSSFVDKFTELFNEVKDIKKSVKSIEENMGKHEKMIVKLNKRVDNSFEKIGNSMKTMEKIKENVTNFESKLKYLEWKSIDLEARSRRDNLVFHGIPENEGRENCFDVITGLIKNNMNISRDIPLARAHRLGPRQNNSIGQRKQRPRPIICAFVDHRDRETVRAARSRLPTAIGVYEDFPIQIRKAREVLLPELREAKQANKKATIAYPARLIVEGQQVKTVDVVDHAWKSARE